VKTERLYLPFVEDADGIGRILAEKARGLVHYVREDHVLSFEGGKITIFGPNSYEANNENSLCILFQTENCDILITGDRGELGEMLLVHDYELPKLEVLIAGHHGSGYSTTPALLEETKPEVAIISAGKNNRYGHPSPKALQRLQNIGCVIYRTDLYGTVIYRR
jgi:competence protein ComEC